MIVSHAAVALTDLSSAVFSAKINDDVISCLANKRARKGQHPFHGPVYLIRTKTNLTVLKITGECTYRNKSEPADREKLDLWLALKKKSDNSIVALLRYEAGNIDHFRQILLLTHMCVDLY